MKNVMLEKILKDINFILKSDISDFQKNKVFKFMQLLKKNIIDKNNKIKIEYRGENWFVSIPEGYLEYNDTSDVKLVRTQILRLEDVSYDLD